MGAPAGIRSFVEASVPRRDVKASWKTLRTGSGKGLGAGGVTACASDVRGATEPAGAGRSWAIQGADSPP